MDHRFTENDIPGSSLSERRPGTCLSDRKFTGNLLSWMRSYHLSNRNQFVQVKEVKSGTSFIKFGVPQGSFLGPKLFSLYVKDFKESITSGELYMFADDTTTFTVSDNVDIIFKDMQDILDQVLSWCGANRLIAHETKGAYHLSKLASQTGHFENEISFFGDFLPKKSSRYAC